MKVAVKEIEFSQLPLTFKKPFRFGSYSLEACPQVFTRVVVEVDGHGISTGIAAEMAVPRWFDKRPEIDPQQNVADLQEALRKGRSAVLGVGESLTVAQLHEEIGVHLSRSCTHLPALVRSFGLAQIEKAVIDAVCRHLQISFAQATRTDLWGIASSGLCADVEQGRVALLLASLKPLPSIGLRHTVGFSTESGAEKRAELIELRELVRNDEIRYLKIKLSGSTKADAQRVSEICALFSASLPSFSLDCNEQYSEWRDLGELCARLAEVPALRNGAFAQKCLYIEQPFARESAMEQQVPQDCPVAVVIDESDDSDDAFVRASARGYRGVSSKACKGVLRSLANIVRCIDRNDGRQADVFVAPEDLCTQPGWALQQDLALAALTGSAHAEKNGHQYVVPFMGMPQEVSAKFLAEHSDLYTTGTQGPCVRVENGNLSLMSINQCRAFGTSVLPDFERFGLEHTCEGLDTPPHFS